MHLQQAIDALPKTREEILDLLRKEEIKGYPRSCYRCIFALYFSKVCGVDIEVSIRGRETGTSKYFARVIGETSYPLGEIVSSIAAEFDSEQLTEFDYHSTAFAVVKDLK
jgi:hypothetical protein